MVKTTNTKQAAERHEAAGLGCVGKRARRSRALPVRAVAKEKPTAADRSVRSTRPYLVFPFWESFPLFSFISLAFDFSSC